MKKRINSRPEKIILDPSQRNLSPRDIPRESLDRQCGCTQSNIWLDIVAIIDVSLSMTQEGLTNVQANLNTIVHELTLSTAPGYSSRISLVTFTSNVTIIAGFNVYNSSDDFETSLLSISLNQNDRDVNILG